MTSALIALAAVVGLALFAIGFELAARVVEHRRDTAHTEAIRAQRKNRRVHANMADLARAEARRYRAEAGQSRRRGAPHEVR